jgi:small subunit ribosomal protein S13
VARIAGVDLPRNKRIEIGLTYIYGIGLSSSQNILTKAQVSSDIRCKDLTDQDISIIREIIDKEWEQNKYRWEVIGFFMFNAVSRAIIRKAQEK